VFFINNGPCVAYSTDPTFITITSKNYITLNQAFQTIITNGFSAPSPNSSDPLFIQLRIKSNNTDIYNMVGMAIQNYLSTKLHSGPVDGTTILSDLREKIVLIIDKNVSPTYALSTNYPKCNNSTESGCDNLQSFTNIESGTATLRKYSYSNLINQATTPPVIIDSDNYDTDISLLRIVVPDTDIQILQNPDSNDFILNYGVQFISNSFFINDSYLKNYEKFFHDNKSAFVPYSKAITYFKN
jgi:hypothetical protein